MIFTVLGEPKGKGRPRITTRGGYAHAYTPKDTTEYENKVRQAFITSGGTKVEGQLYANIHAYFPIPKATTKKNRELIHDDILRPTKKPDCDNIAKIVLDALNGIAYEDDSQVVVLNVSKYYSDEPKVIVSIGVVNEEN